MEISEPREIWDEISGLAICAGSRAARGYLFVALTNSFAIYLARTFTLLGTEVLSEELKLGHIATYRHALRQQSYCLRSQTRFRRKVWRELTQ